MGADLIYDRNANPGWMVADAIRTLGPTGIAIFRKVIPPLKRPTKPHRALSLKSFVEECDHLSSLSARLLLQPKDEAAATAAEEFVAACRQVGVNPPIEGRVWDLPQKDGGAVDRRGADVEVHLREK